MTTSISTETRIKLRIELLRRGMTQLDLAKKLRHPHSTLGSWLRGLAPAPANLLGRIERALKLPPGALSEADAHDVSNDKEP